ncbi:MAG: hypothetical protein KDK03_16900 [Rhodobacteraceae bacterium]|nr:hypothetical protein [Paracoccaceae bacterium]
MAETPDFIALRRKGIARAQALSREVWTDFNLHDPGVTLIEEVAYALTELGYRAEFPVADLLAREDGPADLARLGLSDPREVLAMRPVSADDLARALAASGPSVDHVMVAPAAGADAAGLYDIHVIPAAEADPATALATVREAFRGLRNLCEDVRVLALATPVPCSLEARIEMRRRHAPERVAALIYAQCRRLMRDRTANRRAVPATRADVFEDPARMYGHSGAPEGGAAALDIFFAELVGLEEVKDILTLGFRRLDAPERDPFAPLAPGEFRELVLPERAEDVQLELVSRDLIVPFELEGMRMELARLEADHVARLRETLDGADWSARPEGRRRRFAHLPVGHGLPAAYGAGASRLPASAPARAQGEAAQFRGYLALTDALLANAAADLEGLADLFATDLVAQQSYAARPLDFGPMPELAAEGPEAVAEAVARHDPWHDRKGRVLDHLLALHGEEYTQNTLRQHDLYRGPAARRDAVLENRVRLLREVARLDRDRPGGFDPVAGVGAALCRKLEILLDFPDRSTAPLSAPVTRLGLRLTGDEAELESLRIPRDLLPEPANPFDTIVPRDDRPEPAPPREIIARTAFLASGALTPDLLRRAVYDTAYVLAPEADGAWRLFLDPGRGAAVYNAGRFPGRAEAIGHANRLRLLLTDINRRSEGVHLVEDILLRGRTGHFAPLSLTLILSGWTARTRWDGFRRLAEETVALLCPAHIAHRVLWLGHGEMAEFEALELDWRVALRDAGRGGGPWAEDLDRAAAALRGFLSARGA